MERREVLVGSLIKNSQSLVYLLLNTVKSKPLQTLISSLTNISSVLNKYATFWNESTRLKEIIDSIEQERNIWDRKNFNGHLTAVALVFNPSMDKVLLVDHKFIQKQLAPGGHCDPFEMPESSARRELLEEVGIKDVSLHKWHLENNIPIDIDIHMVPNRPAKNEPPHFHFDFRYLYILNSDESIQLDLTEIDDAMFSPIEQLKVDYLNVYNKTFKLDLI